MTRRFKALVVRSSQNKDYTRAIEDRDLADLPKGDVLIRVHFSSLNYKDGLSCLGNRGVTRHYPHTPGIDAAGIVETSDSDAFTPGEEVIVISHDLGMNTPGGFAQYIRVPCDWVMHLPVGMSLRESMIYGTAGFTAALALESLQHHGVTPNHGPIAVTGASGGVGSISIALFASQGYSVSASTGKSNTATFLTDLGARQVVDRQAVNIASSMNLLKEVWAGAVDTVGDNTLATLLKTCKQGGAIAATGLVESSNLNTSLLPFILRGVQLLGINAQGAPATVREAIWSKLATKWKPTSLERLAVDRDLSELDAEIDRIIAGKQRGRVVIHIP